MNKFTQKLSITLLGLMISGSTLADGPVWVADYWAYGYINSISNALNQIFSDVDAMYKASTNAATQVLQDFSDAISVNTSPNSSGNQGQTYIGAANSTAQTFTGTGLRTFISTPKTTDITAPMLSKLTTSDYPLCSTSGGYFGNLGCTSNPQNFAQMGDDNLSMDSLMGSVVLTTSTPPNAPQGYTLNESQIAQNFIQFVSGTIQPLPVLPIGLPSPKQDDLQSYVQKPAVQNYLIAAHAFTALESVGLSNFNFLYGERLIQPGLGSQANLKTIPSSTNGSSSSISDASLLQIQEYMANRRVYNPAWYSQIMSSSSYIALMKEITFILAEIEYELFQNRLIAERQLAAISAMQLQGLKPGKILLNQQYQAAKSAITGRSTSYY